MKNKSISFWILAGLLLLSIGACARAQASEQPQVHVFNIFEAAEFTNVATGKSISITYAKLADSPGYEGEYIRADIKYLDEQDIATPLPDEYRLDYTEPLELSIFPGMTIAAHLPEGDLPQMVISWKESQWQRNQTDALYEKPGKIDLAIGESATFDSIEGGEADVVIKFRENLRSGPTGQPIGIFTLEGGSDDGRVAVEGTGSPLNGISLTVYVSESGEYRAWILYREDIWLLDEGVEHEN